MPNEKQKGHLPAWMTRRNVIPGAIIGGVLLTLLIVALIMSTGSPGASLQEIEAQRHALKEERDTKKDIANLQTEIRELDEANMKHTNALAKAKAEREHALHMQKQILSLVSSIRKERERFDQLLQTNLSSDDGRRIAANPQQVTQLYNIREDQNVKRRLLDPDEVAKRVSILLAPTEQAQVKSDTVFAPTKEVVQELKALLDEISKAAVEAKQPSTTLETFLAGPSGGKPFHQTLQEALQAVEMEKSLEYARYIDKELADEREQRKETLATAQEEKFRQETALLEQKTRQQAKNIEAEREREALLAEMRADLTDIQKHLTPFIAKSNRQLSKRDWTMVTEKQPVSWSQLVALGVREQGQKGLIALADVGGMHTGNDRPAWPISRDPYHWGTSEPEFLIRAQNLLIKYGDLMVDEGLLAP